MSKDELLAERRTRMLGYIKDGMTADQIADIEGLDLVRARKERKAVADTHGLSTPPNKRAGFTPVGFTAPNRGMRTFLGYKLSDLTTKHKGDKILIARLTGLTQSEQRQAVKASVGHNWTLAQIQRLADALDIPFEELMRYALKGTNIGFK